LLEFRVGFAVRVRDFGQSFGWIRRADVHVGNFGGGGRKRAVARMPSSLGALCVVLAG